MALFCGVLLLSFRFVVLIAGLERGGYEIGDRVVADPILGFRNPAGYAGVTRGGFDMETDQWGFRSLGSHTRPTVTDSTRILCLGDSLTWGYHVSAEESYPAKLQRRYAEAQAPVEVLNAGVIGYSTFQEVRLFERLLELSPDIVLVNLCSNDWLPSDDPFDNVRQIYIDLIRQSLDEGSWQSNERGVLIQAVRILQSPGNVHDAIEALPSEARIVLEKVTVEAPLADLKKLVEERQIRLIYLLIPPLGDTTNYDRLKDIVLQSGIETIDFSNLVDGPRPRYKWYTNRPSDSVLGDLYTVLGAYERRSVFQDRNYMDTWHLTPKGNQLVSERVFERLTVGIPR
jgi:lysophospholipase L1-like esterase